MAAAAKPYLRLIIVVVLIAAGVLAIWFARLRLLNLQQSAENRFVSAYVDLSIARERYGNNPDSLEAAFREIYLNDDIDSAWMAGYVKKLKGDIDKSERIWGKVTARLDSLQKKPPTAGVLSK